MTTATKTKTKRAVGQAARLGNNVDLNVAFSRAYNMFVAMFNRDPNWPKANTKMLIQNGSVICEIQEE